MKGIRGASQFKRDVKQMQRRGKDMGKLRSVLESLVEAKELAAEYRDHVLVGQSKGTRECHIESDWLLIYESAETEIVWIRTGLHSDLFK